MTRDDLEARVKGCPFHRFLGLKPEGLDADAGRVSISIEAHRDLSRSDARVALQGGLIASGRGTPSSAVRAT